MRRIQTISILTGAIATAAVVAFSLTTPMEHLDGTGWAQSQNLKAGDIVFVRGDSLRSRIVNTVDSGCEYTHVGIVCDVEGEPYVIHADPVGGSDGSGEIRLQRISEFLANPRVRNWAVYRVENDTAGFAQEAGRVSRSFWDEKRPFNSSFELSKTNALYCSQLVWLAYKTAGLDLLDERFDEINNFLVKGTVIFPSSLARSRHVNKVELGTKSIE